MGLPQPVPRRQVSQLSRPKWSRASLNVHHGIPPSLTRSVSQVTCTVVASPYAYDEQTQARRTHEEQLDLVLRSVRLRILEKLRYEVREPDAGRVLDIKSEMERP